MVGSSFLVLTGCRRAPVAEPLPQSWELDGRLRTVTQRGRGLAGVVLHVGDSITLDPAYSAWPLSGRGRSPADEAVLRWSHAGTRDARDGWWLCSTLVTAKKSATAMGGIQLRQWLAGEVSGIPLGALLDRYRPQVVVLMLGTNDATVGRRRQEFAADLRTAVGLMTERGIVPILNTLPPHFREPKRAREFNREIHALAQAECLPLIDLHGEMLRRRPGDWQGTLMERNDLHPTAGPLPLGEPTEAELSVSGYLLRAWLTVKKLAELKSQMFAPSAKI